MSEAEVMQGVFSSIQVVISLFSTFFAMISAYIAGLYFFLNRAPVALKLLAFFLLSVGLVFLAGAAISQQRLQVGLLAAWAKMSSPAIAVDAVLRNPFPVSLPPGLVAVRRGRQRWMADRPVRVSGARLHDVPLSLEGGDREAMIAGGDADLMVTRRDILQFSSAAACAAAFPRRSHAQPRPAMLTRPIPSTNEPLPVVGLGTWQTFDVGAERAALDQRKEVLRILLEAGGKVIDSSPMYGRAEAVVGTLLTEMQAHAKTFLATKVWTSGEAAGVAQMKASAAKLQAPVIDLMQIHNLLDWRTHLATLRAWKEQKKFRYIGITHYTDPALDELAAIIRAERIDFVQFGYSIASRAAEARLLPLCAERGVAVLVNQPFDSGSPVRPGERQGPARVGLRARLRQLEPVLPQVHPGPPRRHLRDPRHRPARPHARQPRRRPRPPAGRGPAQAHGGVLGRAVRASR